MCGRFALRADPKDLSRIYDVPLLGGIVPWQAHRWNIAPSQPVRTIRERSGERQMAAMSWGLVPFWVKDLKEARKPINARADTVATSPAFRAAFKRRRCVIPASAFYEWQKIEGEKRKQPFAIVPTDDEVFSLAGVWESWGDDDERLETVAIITVPPNAVMGPIHDRMPAILTRDEVDRWLAEGASERDALAMLDPFPDRAMRAYPVSTRVNSPANDDAACLAPIE